MKSTLFAVSLVVITGCGAKRKAAGKDSVAPADAGLARTHKKTTGGTKRDASSQAAGAKRQARRDSR